MRFFLILGMIIVFSIIVFALVTGAMYAPQFFIFIIIGILIIVFVNKLNKEDKND